MRGFRFSSIPAIPDNVCVAERGAPLERPTTNTKEAVRGLGGGRSGKCVVKASLEVKSFECNAVEKIVTSVDSHGRRGRGRIGVGVQIVVARQQRRRMVQLMS